MIHIRGEKEIKKFSQSCQIVKDTLNMLEKWIRPGITSIELDIKAENYIRSMGAKPGFKGLYGYPATLCISIDDEVVHGIPSNRKLKEGEIISIDVGSYLDGFYGDHARSFSVGKVDSKRQKLMDVTHQCLLDAIAQASPGNHIGDIGYAVQSMELLKS